MLPFKTVPLFHVVKYYITMKIMVKLWFKSINAYEMRWLEVYFKQATLRKIDTKWTPPLIHDAAYLLNIPQDKIDIFFQEIEHY